MAGSLQFLGYLRTLSLKLQKATTKIGVFLTLYILYILWSHTLWNNDHLHLTICVICFFCPGTDYIGTIGSRLLNPGPTWKYFATLSYFTYFSFTCWFFCHLPEPQKFQTEDIIVSKTYLSRIWHFWTYILWLSTFWPNSLGSPQYIIKNILLSQAMIQNW